MISVFTVCVANTKTSHLLSLRGAGNPNIHPPVTRTMDCSGTQLNNTVTPKSPAHEMPSTHQVRDTPVLPVISQLRHLDDCHGCHG
jgi:hypothetical protein